MLPVADKTMARNGDEVVALLKNEHEYTNALAAMRAGGAPPEDFPSRFDWVEYVSKLAEYATSEERALPYFNSRGRYNAPEAGSVDEVHKALDQTLRDRRTRYYAARPREEAAYIQLSDLVERAAAQAPGAEVSERTQRHVVGVERAELNAAQKAYACEHGYCACVPTEDQKDPVWAASQKKALEKALKPPSKECRVDKMSSCQCELGWGLVMVISYFAYLEAKLAGDAAAMALAIEALRNIV